MEKRRTLKQLLLWAVSIILVMLLLGNVMFNVSITRDYLENQMQSHAQDAATSLGLSLSNVIDARDQVAASRMIDAIFDSGDYRKIALLDLKGEVKVERVSDVKIQSVPDWFVSFIPLAAPSKSAQVVSGWTQLGTLEVESHPGYAYVELWQVIKTQLGWFAVVTSIGLLMLRVFISRLLIPLDHVEKQAHEMEHKQFDYRAPIPNTRELARVATAMNEMAETLGKMFKQQLTQIEGLREQAVMDSLTGLHNRDGFDRRLRAQLESEESIAHGTLFLLKINDFEGINQELGRQEGDELLRSVASVLAEEIKSHSGAFAARRAGADFSLFLPDIMPESADDAASHLMSRFGNLSYLKHVLRDELIHMGVACVKDGDDTRSLFSKVDMALRQAQGKGVSAWQRYAHLVPDEALDEVRQANEWQAILQEVLAKQSVELHAQPVYSVAGQELLYHQILARITVDDRLVVAGLFLPMAERFNLMVPFDQMMVEKVLAMQADGMLNGNCCVTLSESSLSNEGFLNWLEKRLAKSPEAAKSMIFEVTEHVVNFSEKALDRLCRLARDKGFRVSIERFGASSVPFSYLQRVKVGAIKVDHSFIRDVNENQDNQFFLRSAIQIAHSQAIEIIAVGVESEQELAMLKELGMDGAMGYYLGRPGPVSDIS